MLNKKLRFLFGLAISAALALTSSLQAGWGHHYAGGGSWGGSSGGYGGSSGGWGGSSGGWGGSSGGWGGYSGGWGGSYGGGSYGGGSYGGYAGRHGLFHHHHHRGWSGSSGFGYGSSGGGYGYGSSGGGSSGGYSYGSSGGGSSGGSGGGVNYSPVVPGEIPAAPAAPGDLPKADVNKATLKVAVPQDALVYVNGILTKSTGADRTYVSRGLLEGFQYTYEVRAEAVRDGQKVEEVKVVNLKAGERSEIAFNSLQPAKSTETTLTLNVPAEAKVSLAGNATIGSGAVRTFKTSKLSADGEWSNYVVEVSIDRDGQTVTQEKTITLKAGDSQTLTFDFDREQVAAR